MIYAPPQLPDCLSGAHLLNPIVGVPTDDEVRAIHAAIRAVNGILTAPSLYDPDLLMQLAQHLFVAQMAMYRSQYGFSLLADATYAPPSLPSHIPVGLEPVVGAPSNEELRLTQSAVRAMESLSTSPSIFDPDLSMKLSQHLFNIQAARFIQDSSRGRFDTGSTGTRSIPKQQRPRAAPVDPAFEPTEPPGGNVPDDRIGKNSAESNSGVVPNPDNSLSPLLRDVKTAQDETNRLLGEVGCMIRNINTALVSTQRTVVRAKHSNYGNMINEKGELPRPHGLPDIGSHERGITTHSLSDTDLARYLQFYNIGAELLEGGQPRIRSGQRDSAVQVLNNHVIKLF